MENQKIFVGVNCVHFNNPKANHRQKMAMEVLLVNKPDNVEVVNFCYHGEQLKEYKDLNTIYLKRNSREEMGNDRPLPYIKEIMNHLSKLSNDNDIFGYINSDILLTKEFFNHFEDEDAFVFSRIEITDIDSVRQFNDDKYKALWGGDTHAGADGFFFRKKWWEENEGKFSWDFIVGESEWDTAYRHLIAHLTNSYVYERALLHVYHDAKWSINSIGAKNNIKLWEQVRNDYA